MHVNKVTLPLDAVQWVLWHVGDTNLGVQPGGFTRRLLELANVADEENLGKLAAEWPALMYAWYVASRTPWGFDWLRGLAKAELDGAEQGLDFGAVAS